MMIPSLGYLLLRIMVQQSGQQGSICRKAWRGVVRAILYALLLFKVKYLKILLRDVYFLSLYIMHIFCSVIVLHFFHCSTFSLPFSFLLLFRSLCFSSAGRRLVLCELLSADYSQIWGSKFIQHNYYPVDFQLTKCFYDYTDVVYWKYWL